MCSSKHSLSPSDLPSMCSSMVLSGRSKMTNDRAHKARSPSSLAALAGLIVVACFNGSPDSPNGRERDNSGRAYRFKVTREADARMLASGWSNNSYSSATIQAQIGDRLVYDILEEVVAKPDVGDPRRCSTAALVGHSLHALVDKLECWGMAPHGAARGRRAEPIPAVRNQEPPPPYLRKGKG